MKEPRGFSLFLVMLVLIGMAVLGLTTLAIGTTEAGTADARAVQRQALAAADAGLNHFLGSAPAKITENEVVVGTDDTFVPLIAAKNSRGQTVQSRYRVRTRGAAPVANGFHVESEGEVLVEGKVVGRSLIRAIVSATAGGGAKIAGSGQKSANEWGTSTNQGGRTDISLETAPFQ